MLRGKRTCIARHPRNARCRGAVYMIILPMVMIITVILLSASIVERVRIRKSQAASHQEEARTLAMAAVENALNEMKNQLSWRDIYFHDVPITPINFGNGTFEWKILDEAPGGTDSNLADDDTEPVRIYGTGKVGNAVRTFSVRIAPADTATGLDVLSTAIYAEGNIGASSTTTASGGPIVSLGTISSESVLNANVEANNIVNPSLISGTKTTPATARQAPDSSLFDELKALATEISFGSIPSNAITLKVVSAASNPYGTPNANAIYHISVPNSTTLQLKQSRIKATLLITLGTGSSVFASQANSLETPDTGNPIMLVKGGAGSFVILKGTQQGLREDATLVNFNPPGTPFNGTEDNDILDSYPSEMRGVIQVFGSGTTTEISSSASIIGSVITEGVIDFGSNAIVTVNPLLKTNPPPGYSTPGPMQVQMSSFRREVAPTP